MSSKNTQGFTSEEEEALFETFLDLLEAVGTEQGMFFINKKGENIVGIWGMENTKEFTLALVDTFKEQPAILLGLKEAIKYADNHPEIFNQDNL